MDPAEIEEANKLRISLGMKPLPVPGASNAPSQGPDADESDDESGGLGSTLERRESKAYDNYRKLQEADQAKRKREQKTAAIKKARDQAQRYAVLEGKGLGDLDEEEEADTKAWLKGHKKRQKKNDDARKLGEKKAAEAAAAAAAAQHSSKDLTGVKVSHEISGLLDGGEQVLTLKDSTVLENEEEGDELENLDLRDQEKLDERLQLKKKKPLYDPNEVDETGERTILAQYDEVIGGKEKKTFTLDAAGLVADLGGLPGLSRPDGQVQSVDLDILQDVQPSDYLDASEIKVKKPKKKKTNTTRDRRRGGDEDGLLVPESGLASEDVLSMDVDSAAGFAPKKRKAIEESFADDDDDLQKSLALQRRGVLKKRRQNRPEDIARQLREESAAASPGPEDNPDPSHEGGLVIDETTEFVGGLRKPGQEEDRKRDRKAQPSMAAMDSEDDEEMGDAPAVEDGDSEQQGSRAGSPTGAGVDEEKTIGEGIGQALQLLRERKLLEDGSGASLNEDYRHKQQFLAEKERRMAAIAEETRNRRERDRASGRMERMSIREREEWQRQQNSYQDQQTSRMMLGLFDQRYKPNVELKYTDEFGRSLDQKEAFKHLSHMFHGKGSGKGKTDKRLKKIEDEKRRESQSMLDASQNVGMSSATAQQLKKRNEAGVRLA